MGRSIAGLLAGGWLVIASVGSTMLAADIVAPVGTKPLEWTEDPAAKMIDGINRFLLHKTTQAALTREVYWLADGTDGATAEAMLDARRNRLRDILGLADQAPSAESMIGMSVLGTDSLVAESESVVVYRIRWPALSDPAPTTQALTSVWAEGLLLVPKGQMVADVIAVPDADQSPEALCGLEAGTTDVTPLALRLARAGCRVVVPMVTSRQQEKRGGRAVLTDREYIHRSAFVLGRTLVGYEVQKVLAAIDWLQASGNGRPIGGIGYGEGGQLITLAAAIDTRLDVTAVSGFFATRVGMWQEPLDRNLNGFLREFDAAHLGLLIAPRGLVIEASGGPEVKVAGNAAAPGKLLLIEPSETQRAVDELRTRLAALRLKSSQATAVELVIPPHPATDFGTGPFLTRFFDLLCQPAVSVEFAKLPAHRWRTREPDEARRQRQARRRKIQLAELDRHNQRLWRESAFVRADYFAKLDRSDLDTFARTIEPYRDRFRDDVIGHFDEPLLPFNARSRESWKNRTWTGYEVALDVFPDVVAYGVLLLPNDLQPGEQRPVVVCQHGLEGRPTDTFQDNHRAYQDYAAKLCEQGYVVFAPQNPYLFEDRFRTLQRKAQPLGCSLFSVIVPQHQQIVNWLKSQPFVDGDRIAFYGLSYGGKSAMRIPALVTDYCLSICSADFNEWVLKNASTRDRFSYVWTGEYEIFEWNLGSTFNYSEMASLICPRPFMVERGHFDGVGLDEWVAFEFAKVRHLYAARLGIPDRTAIEWFAGPHTIHGKGTFEFLSRHLQWPERTASDEP